MAFCTNCGTKVDDGVKFCPSCGTKLAADTPVQPEPPVQPAAPVQEEPVQVEQPVQFEEPVQFEQPAQPKPPKKKSKLPLILGIAAAAGVVVIGVIVAVVLLVSKNLGGAAASDNPDLGLYHAASAEMFGVAVEVDDMWAKGFDIELKDKNKCDISVDGQKGSGKWELDGEQLHISGSGLDCDGTLKNGMMTLDNVLGTGMTLTFVQEGRALNQPGAGTSLPAGEPASDPAGDPAQWNALQQQWNGVWYGVMQLKGCTGKYESFSYTTYDVYLDVAVDANGTGEYRLYDADELIGAAFCQAQEAVLNTTEGVIFGQDMYAYNWMFLPDPNNEKTYCMTDEITDGDGDVLSLAIWVKPWGESWQSQIDSDFYAYPPNHDSYMAMVSAGQKPTLGGGAAAAPSAPSAAGSTGAATGNTGAGLTGPTDVFQLTSSGYVVMDYPTNDYKMDDEAFMPSLIAKDGSTTIMAVTLLSESAIPDTIEGLRDSYADYDQYSERTLKLGGYDVTCITYYDEFFGYNAEYVVDFAQDYKGFFGVKFVVTSQNSMDVVLGDAVRAILDTVRLA